MASTEKDRIAQLWKPAGEELDKRNGLKAHEIDTSWDNMAPAPEEPEVKKPIDWVAWIGGVILVVLGLGLIIAGVLDKPNTNALVASGIVVLLVAFIFVAWWTNEGTSEKRPIRVRDTRGFTRGL